MDTATPFAIELPDHWTGSFELKQTPSGTYVGMASLSFGGVQRCVLVITGQRSWDEALERAKLRAGHFVKAWGERPRD
jgi:hypothetical protein